MPQGRRRAVLAGLDDAPRQNPRAQVTAGEGVVVAQVELKEKARPR